ncbi:Crp/Fnr family transcriptional regulator [uncultured Mailhella sp.]|mgnify:CR=1 FL=1|uniref:Crp/Fnr family transcriptional regulator n=1 Tax=uncultured Mailhella sp. TaxID=1981031 RepID=UPI0025F6A7F7|nr:Crp/Fnr family transcriptional regulator [uncultured Mailhella sp.]
MHIFRPGSRRFLPGMVDNLSPEWKAVLSAGRRMVLKKGEFLLPDGETRSFGYLTSGRICSTHTSYGGGAHSMLIFGPGTLVREAYVCSGFCQSLPHFQCLTDVECHIFPGDLLHDERFIAAHPELMRSMLYSVSVKLSLFDAMLSIMSCRTVEEKVAMWMYYCCDSCGRSSFSPGISQIELSLLLGVHKSSLNKVVLALKKHGILECFTKTRLSILDERRLFRAACGELLL